MSPTLNFSIHRSLHKVYMLIVLHTVAVFACWLANVELSGQLGLTMLIFLSLIIQLRGYTEKNVNHLRYSDLNGWELSLNNLQFFPVTIMVESVLTSRVMVLYCKAQDVHVLVVFQDALPGNQYQKLLATIRTSGH